MYVSVGRCWHLPVCVSRERRATQSSGAYPLPPWPLFWPADSTDRYKKILSHCATAQSSLERPQICSSSKTRWTQGHQGVYTLHTIPHACFHPHRGSATSNTQHSSSIDTEWLIVSFQKFGGWGKCSPWTCLCSLVVCLLIKGAQLVGLVVAHLRKAVRLYGSL